MRIYLKYVDGFELGAGEDAYLGHWEEILRSLRGNGISQAATPGESDLVMVLESGRYKCRRYARTLLDDPVIATHWDKVMTINYDDNPAGFLPGLYANLPSRRMIPDFLEAFCYLFPPRIPESRLDQTAGRTKDPGWLFTFRGAESHPVRKALFSAFAASEGPWRVTHIDRWYNHTPAETESYYDELMESAFVLCPRGISTATHRLFEVMAMGRCPVIISDEWVPIPGPNWDECSVRIPEGGVNRIPEILMELKPRAEHLGAQAKQIWKRYFSYEARFMEATARLQKLRGRIRRPPLAREIARWSSKAFLCANGWDWKSRVGNHLHKMFRPTRAGNGAG